jgi:uncharacterized membrane protein
MTDNMDTTPDTTAVVAAEADDTGATVVGAIGDDTGQAAVGELVTDYDYAAIVAAFSTETLAMTAYQALLEDESEGTLQIDGVLVIKTDDDGNVKIQKMTDHSTKTGLEWGVVGGLLVGIIFPPAIIASTVGWGVVGATLGKLRNELHKSDVGEALAGTLGPNESGIVALVKATDVAATIAAMPPATKVRSAGVDDKTAKKIEEAAKQAS